MPPKVSGSQSEKRSISLLPNKSYDILTISETKKECMSGNSVNVKSFYLCSSGRGKKKPQIFISI
jgi:hypothetical protein